jgi:hypothetical protein
MVYSLVQILLKHSRRKESSGYGLEKNQERNNGQENKMEKLLK